MVNYNANLDRFQCIPLATFNSASLTGSYQTMNTTGFSEAVKIVKLINDSNVTITVSYDGVTDHDVFPAGLTQIMDFQANHASASSSGIGTLNGAKGQIVFGKGSAGTGNFYIVGYY